MREQRSTNRPSPFPRGQRDRSLSRLARRFLRWEVIAFVAAGWSGSALAQAPTAYGTAAPQQRYAPPPGQDFLNPREQAAESYAPQGVKVGSFLLFPSLELDEAYNDNIYASSSGKVGSFVQVVSPSVQLRSQWGQHALNFFARGNFGFYSADATQNYQDINAGFEGRYDISRESNFYGGAAYTRAHYFPGTPNAVSGSFPIAMYNQYTTNAGYYQQFGRFRARLDGRFDAYDYLNNGQNINQGFAPNSDLNRIELRESLRVGYEFLPGAEIWTRGALNQRDYQNSPDSSGLFRNSSGYEVVGGFAFLLSTITSFEVFAGYIQQNYVDPAFPTISVPTFGLTGYWSPTRQILVKPYILRTIDDSSLSDAAAYINTTGGLDVNYSFRPNIRLDGHADYTVANYQTAQGTAGRYDQYVTVRAGVMYLPTPNFFVGPTYQFVHRTSNQVGFDYDDNQILLRLGAQL
ncbi:outer membrane beta-barrel protein [Reyranella sp.]|uniref:outer membrane beta-barrel protein n=1 Tax=Reyranella sp. TaxID=1929291 RepID=UPI002F95E6E0